MTANPETEVALFEMKEAPVAERAPRGRRSKKSEVAKTQTGESAQDIMKAWIDICQKRTGVPVPEGVIKRLSRQVKSLIVSGYQTNQIKNGLTLWTVRWMDNPLINPEQLERLTWKIVMDASPEGRRFQAELKEAVTRFMGKSPAVTGGMSKQEKRNVENTQGQMGWRERYAERKRREEGL